MVRWRERDAQRSELDRLPFIEFVDNVKSEPVNETTNTDRNDDRLIGSNCAQRSAIEMIKMRVSHEHEIDRRQMMNVKARLLQSFNHAQPHRPNRIDQHIGVVRLDQKRRMPDPSDADLARLHLWKKRPRTCAGTFGEERRDPNAGNEIAFGPITAGTQFNAPRFFCAAVLRVANNLAFIRKRIRHYGTRYNRGGSH